MAATYLQPVSHRRRAVAIGLTILVHLAIIWLLLNLTPAMRTFSTDNGLQSFDVAASRPAAQAKKQHQQKQQEKRVTRTETKVVPPKAPPVEFKNAPNVIWMSKEEYAKTDISKLKRLDDADEKLADAGAGGTGGKGGPGDSKPISGPGAGPGGQQLYAAEWYREPTPAELNPFLPPMPPGSSGTIACRTAPRYAVENCQIMGESPLGSGIATGMRRAAWQFKVIPPRINGQPQIGTWVQIRIYFTDRGAAVRR